MTKRPTDKPEKSSKPKYHTRWMINRDLGYVLAIERACFEFAWTEEDFRKCGNQRNCILMVAEANRSDYPIGFMAYELHASRLHILNFAVHPDHWRQGVGTAMVDKLKAKLSNQRRIKISLEVRETNIGAQLFFRRHGFMAFSVLRGFYIDSTEDAYVMEFHL